MGFWDGFPELAAVGDVMKRLFRAILGDGANGYGCGGCRVTKGGHIMAVLMMGRVHLSGGISLRFALG